MSVGQRGDSLKKILNLRETGSSFEQTFSAEKAPRSLFKNSLTLLQSFAEKAWPLEDQAELLRK